MIAPLSAVILALILLLGASVWVGFALMATGAISLSLFTDVPVGKLLAFDLWASLNSPELVALPMFILMGEILFHTRLSENLFNGLAPLMRRVPGRLFHVNVAACTLFAAVSGSSAATTATVGRMTLAELEKRGYDRDLAMGSLCGAGTLGFLIPPSIILILYGVLAEVSILSLFIAGLIPGLLLAFLYMVYIAIRAGRAGEGEDQPGPGFFRAIGQLGPVLLLIALVLGSMYAGIASPSEAAIIGVFGALLVAAFQKSLSGATLKKAFFSAVRTNSMIGLIIAGALFLSKAIAFLGLPSAIAAGIAGLGLNPLALIFLLLIFYIALGTVLDGLSTIVMTLPIVLPLVTAAGFDPIWFGIFLVIAVEMAQITPPVGFNLFVVQGLTGESISRIARASLPFFLIMAAFAVLIAVFPGIVMFLPDIL